MKCEKCGQGKTLFGCQACHPYRTLALENLSCLLIIGLLFLGAIIYAVWQDQHPTKPPRVPSALVDAHKNQIDSFFKEMKTEKAKLSGFEYLGWESWPRGPLTCGDYQEGHTDTCRVFSAGIADQQLASEYCSQTLTFAKALGATEEFTNELNEPTALSERSLVHCIANYKTGYLLTGISRNQVPIAFYLYANDANYEQLVLSPRYEHMDMKLTK
jgi:hypothetical protein